MCGAKLQKSCGVWVCYRSTTCAVYPMVATISPRQNIWGNTQTDFACAKKLSLKATTVNSSPQNFIWHFWHKTDTSGSLVLLQEYWQVKRYLQHHLLKQHKLNWPLCTLTPLVILWEEVMGIVLVSFCNQLIIIELAKPSHTRVRKQIKTRSWQTRD